ncbi:hypothetical protein E4U41_007704 [Claviceps citrina]|nr:hypothetical protein E4U41_007704 [Claviceps citrina]
MELSSLSRSLALATLAVLAPLSQAVPLDVRADAPTVPTEDPFYTVPDNLTNVQAGTILRQRKPPFPIAAFRFAKQHLQDTHQFLYRTTDNFGNATATVLTVLVPYNADFGKVISQQTLEDASDPNCAPSYVLQFKSRVNNYFGTITTQSDIIMTDAFLAQGWVVIIPDYEGPKAEFLAHKQSGQAVLDGIRAALSSTDTTGIRADATVALTGYSAGSLAVGFAAEWQPLYAPELKIAGAAIGGPVPNLTNAFQSINGGAFAGLIPAGIVGLAKAYPELEKLVDEQLLPEHKEKYEQTKQQCFVPNTVKFLFSDFLSFVKDKNIFKEEPSKSILEANSQGQHVPTMPLFVYKSINDEVSPIADTDALVKFYCDGGASVEYVRDRASEHATLELTSSTLVMAWLTKVMNGTVSASANCSTRSEFTVIEDKNNSSLPRYLLSALKALLGKRIGPGGLMHHHE